MNGLIMCTAVALNIFSMPAGNTVVGTVPAYKAVMLMDGSLLRDWVFIGKPGPDGISPRGWVKYEYLGQCPNMSGARTRGDQEETPQYTPPQSHEKRCAPGDNTLNCSFGPQDQGGGS